MEFQEFCKKRLRMCEAIHDRDCGLCHPSFGGCHTCEQRCIANPERAEEIVEQWAKEHPIITNSDKFKEVFGKPIESYGAPYLNALIVCNETTSLEWLQMEYKKPEEDND